MNKNGSYQQGIEWAQSDIDAGRINTRDDAVWYMQVAVGNLSGKSLAGYLDTMSGYVR